MMIMMMMVMVMVMTTRLKMMVTCCHFRRQSAPLGRLKAHPLNSGCHGVPGNLIIMEMVTMAMVMVFASKHFCHMTMTILGLIIQIVIVPLSFRPFQSQATILWLHHDGAMSFTFALNIWKNLNGGGIAGRKWLVWVMFLRGFYLLRGSYLISYVFERILSYQLCFWEDLILRNDCKIFQKLWNRFCAKILQNNFSLPTWEKSLERMMMMLHFVFVLQWKLGRIGTWVRSDIW